MAQVPHPDAPDRWQYDAMYAIANELASIREILHALVLTKQGQNTAAGQHLQASQRQGP